MFSKVSLLLTTVLTVSLGAGHAAAQEEDADVIEINGRYLSLDQLNSVKTPTPVIDVPQSLSIITDAQIAEQGFVNFGDILRYTPGLSISQGEGHRDAINIRGNQSTADFFLNGIRDDVQYYRPLYNLEQVEILRGSNALLFGRGGGGGVVNRVTKSPVIGEAFQGYSAAIDTFGAGQLTADINLDTGDQSGLRLNAFVEEMANHRDAFAGNRYGINPTAQIALGNETTLTAFYEYLDDDRVVDRGVPSIAVPGAPGRPLEGYDNTFFGSRDRNRTTLQAHTFRVRVDHEFTDQLRGNVTAQYADYDKAYQNIYAAGFDPTVTPSQVTLDGYRDTTARTNLIVQGNLVGEFQTGSIGHTLLVGGEFGDQDTDNARTDNLFVASNDDQITIDFTDPLIIPDFDFVTPARDRSSSVQFTSFYIQDQIDLTDTLKVMVGARFDRFDVSVLDRQAISATDNGRRGRVDEELSPRFGLIYKPAENISVYASYSETFLPSAGDQFLTLSTTTEDIQPQTFENREIGAKWDINADLSFTAAIFRLERGQFTTVDPDDPSIVTTVAGSTTEGFELQLVGEITDAWSLNAGYSYLDGVVEGGGFDGNSTRQTPEHMLSLWNRYQINGELAVALGATYQDASFVLENNGVELPGYTRFDAAVFYDLSEATRLQLNVENLFDTDYFPDAHSNSNISTGEPLNARLSISHEF
ncbi:TonB-dependent siderophore receptor [uncultured Maricaulis sp.]|uniref:TonB-dependent receptor n=1 Tax=uncultured Maricaulis sp. TaxID=174710 RepID=UPI0026034A44|nr:TonB-dependent siderophore receptor [uncultured Maricaulis sp.]